MLCMLMCTLIVFLMCVIPCRSITGENWNLIMQDCMVKESCLLVQYDYTLEYTNSSDSSTASRALSKGDWLDKGDPDRGLLPDGLIDDQCSVAPIVAVLFFGSFMLLCSYLLLQLVIAVVLDNVQEQYEMEEMVIHQDHLWSFVGECASSSSTSNFQQCGLPHCHHFWSVFVIEMFASLLYSLCVFLFFILVGKMVPREVVWHMLDNAVSL